MNLKNYLTGCSRLCHEAKWQLLLSLCFWSDHARDPPDVYALVPGGSRTTGGFLRTILATHKFSFMSFNHDHKEEGLKARGHACSFSSLVKIVF